MTAAVVSLAVALAAGIAAIAWLARKLEGAFDGQMRVNKLYVDERDVADGYLHERDEALRQLSEADKLSRSLKQRIAMLEMEVNRASQKAAEQIVERLRAANVADASRLVDELLASPVLPGLPQAPTAPTNRDDGG